MSIRLACVYFPNEKRNFVLAVKDITDLQRPRSVNDFDSQKLYNVRWPILQRQDSDSTEGTFSGKIQLLAGIVFDLNVFDSYCFSTLQYLRLLGLGSLLCSISQTIHKATMVAGCLVYGQTDFINFAKCDILSLLWYYFHLFSDSFLDGESGSQSQTPNKAACSLPERT